MSVKQTMIMSSTSNVCQGLPSCLEPCLVEPLVSMFQLAHSKPNISVPCIQLPSLCGEENSFTGNIVSCANNYPSDKSNKNGELGGWNTIQSLSNSSNSDHVYVHPLDKRSSSAMSTKSLEMCTESLGSETGSNINGDMDEFTSLQSMERQNPSEIRRLKTHEISKKINKNSFPPPLTSISGSNGVQVSTHREGGRLVIKAVNSSSSSIILFQTERKNGRLRLSLPKEDCRHFYKQMVDKNEEEEEEEKDDDDDDDEEENAYETENEFYDNNNGGDEGEADFNGGFWGENGGKIGCKIGSAEWSRCKGDSKRLQSLHFCVAIS